MGVVENMFWQIIVNDQRLKGLEKMNSVDKNCLVDSVSNINICIQYLEYRLAMTEDLHTVYRNW